MNIAKSQNKIRAIGFSLAIAIIYLLNSVLVGGVYGVLLAIGIIGDGSNNITTYIDNNSISFLASISIISIIIFGIILCFKQRSSKVYLNRPFVSFIGKLEKRKLIESLILFFGVLGFTFLWVGFISFLSKSNPFYKSLLESHDSTMGQILDTESFLLMFTVIVIIVPITEELFFRGLIYGRLRQAMPSIVAGLISSIVFGVFHGNVVQGIYAFCIGCILAAVYEKTDSLLLSIFGHSLINAIGTAIPYLELDKLHLVLVILAWIALIPGIIILRKWFLKSKNVNKVQYL